MSRYLGILAAVFALALAAGCRTSPVFNVTDAPISAKGQSQQAIGKAIQKAGVALGWQMKDMAPGHIVGTLYLRSHMAQVAIKYNTKSYDIIYKDSEDLSYNGSKIHSNYNAWVQNLDKRIQAELSIL